MRASNDEKEDDVSEDMLRMVVDEAQRSNTGIDSGEGRMIKAVLDMQDKAVGKIMQPRVDIVGVPEGATAAEILKIVVENRYSRIPVYRGDVDNVVGMLSSKLSLSNPLDFCSTSFLKLSIIISSSYPIRTQLL